MNKEDKHTNNSKPMAHDTLLCPVYCLDCGWSGDMKETTKEAVGGFENEASEYIPACPECSYDIRIQE